MPTMTCQETLAFYGGVSLGGAKWTRASRNERVEEVLAAVGLGHTAHTLVSIVSAAVTVTLDAATCGSWVLACTVSGSSGCAGYQPRNMFSADFVAQALRSAQHSALNSRHHAQC